MAGPDYYFCIAHEAPWFALPDRVEVIATGAYQAAGRLNIRDSKRAMGGVGLNVDSHYEYLTGTAGSLYASELLDSRDTVGKSVCIFQYRKLVASDQVGTRSDNFPYMRMLPRPVSARQMAEIFASYQSTTLVAHPFFMADGLLSNHASNHHVSDFLLLTYISVKVGVLKESEVIAFFNTKLFIPGGVEFGIFPCALFVGIMERVRLVLDDFLKAHKPANTQNAYQRRGLSFFTERLTNYLLIKELGWPTLAEGHNGGPIPLPAENIGYMCTISENGAYRTFGQHPSGQDAEGVMDLGTGALP